MNKTVAILEKIMFFFMCVLVFWLPYSSAVVEVAVSLLSALWIIKRIVVGFKNRLFQQPGNKFTNFFLAFKPVSSPLNIYILFFIIVGLLSAAGSVFPEKSIYGFFAKTMEWFIVYFLVIEILREKKYIYIFLGIALFTAFSTGLDGLYQFYISSKDIFMGHEIEPHSRATAAYKTGNDLAGHMTIIIPIAFSLLFMRLKRPSMKWLLAGAFIICLWCVIVTFTRGAWIGIVLGVCIFLLNLLGLIKQDYFQKYRAYFLVLTLLIFFLPLVLWLKGIDVRSHEQNDSVSWRQTVWTHTYYMIGEAPVFGHGPNTFMRIFQEYYQLSKAGPTYAHNCFLQITAEMGLLGITCFLAILYQIFNLTIRGIYHMDFKEDNLKVISLGILSGLVAYLVHSFFDTNLYSTQLSVHFWMFVGALVSINNLFHRPDFHDIRKS